MAPVHATKAMMVNSVNLNLARKTAVTKANVKMDSANATGALKVKIAVGDTSSTE